MANVWSIHGQSMATSWPIQGQFMANPWPLHGQFKANSWPIHKQFMNIDRHRTSTKNRTNRTANNRPNRRKAS
eukprot:4844747-Lingulodinium_polyedra.AAC.1